MNIYKENVESFRSWLIWNLICWFQSYKVFLKKIKSDKYAVIEM